MRRILIGLAAAATLAAPASAEGWKDLTGQKVPDISAKEWFNAGDKAPSVEDLRGTVWILEFFATW